MKFKKLINIVSIFIMLIFLTSCSTFNASLDSLLISPTPNEISIKGTWKIEQFYYIDNSTPNSLSKIPKGSYVFLTDTYLRINDSLFEYENYKVKNTTLSNYLRIKFKISDFSFLNLGDKNVNVFIFQDKQKNIYEFIKYDEDTLLFYYNDIMYLLKKVSNDVDKDLEEYVKNNFRNDNLISDISIQDVGFLISFKSDRELGKSSSIPKSFYKTIWFYQDDSGVYSHKIYDGILIPKDNQVLSINVELSDKNNLYEKISVTKKMLDKNNNLIEEKQKYNNTNEEFINQFIDITYVNENYIGINYDQNTEYLGKVNTNKLALLPINEPFIEKRLKFSDVFENNTEDFYNSRNKFLKYVNEKNLEMYDSEVREDSFKLLRYAGSWFLRGRINPKIGYDVPPLDFDIDVLPGKKFLRYVDSSVNLSEIKLKQPDVVDAFLSPNKDIMVVLSKDSMNLYKVIDGKVSNNTIGEFPIKKSDMVILSQWYLSEDAEEVNKLLIKIK